MPRPTCMCEPYSKYSRSKETYNSQSPPNMLNSNLLVISPSCYLYFQAGRRGVHQAWRVDRQVPQLTAVTNRRSRYGTMARTLSYWTSTLTLKLFLRSTRHVYRTRLLLICWESLLPREGEPPILISGRSIAKLPVVSKSFGQRFPVMAR